MALVVCYILVCIIRLTMPWRDPRARGLIFVIRCSGAVLGGVVVAGWFWLETHRPIFKDPHVVMDNGEYIAKMLFLLCVVIGEYVARRQMRRLNVFPANRRLPWTY